jgi:hypothetical protein
MNLFNFFHLKSVRVFFPTNYFYSFGLKFDFIVNLIIFCWWPKFFRGPDSERRRRTLKFSSASAHDELSKIT